MKMTPLDIRQKRFEATFRGYSRREVEGFLELTASEFEEVVRENISAKEELHRLQTQLEQHVDREKALQETMVTAQRISEDIKLAAKREAEVLLAEAELQGDKIIASANNRLVDIVKEINELKRQKVQFETQVESIVDAHKKLLETFKTPVAQETPYLVKKS
jgi:cell division initiation protein